MPLQQNVIGWSNATWTLSKTFCNSFLCLEEMLATLSLFLAVVVAAFNRDISSWSFLSLIHKMRICCDFSSCNKETTTASTVASTMTRAHGSDWAWRRFAQRRNDDRLVRWLKSHHHWGLYESSLSYRWKALSFCPGTTLGWFPWWWQNRQKLAIITIK